MVVKRQCSFCASEIEPGTGTMFVKRDGTVYHFCSSSCRKQQLHLGRVGHRFKWTRAHALKVQADHAGPARSPAPSPPPSAGRPARRAATGPTSPKPAPSVPVPEPKAPAATEDAGAPSPEPAVAPTATESPAPRATPAKRTRARKKPPSPPSTPE